MAGMSAALPWISAGGTLLSAFGQYSAGQSAKKNAAASAAAAKQAAEYQAVQHEYLAGQVTAASQREAMQQEKTARLMASRALAVAAASGAGASDPTVTKIIADITGEGAYRAALAMYEGEEEAKFHRMSAEAARETGMSVAAARTAEGASIARASQLSMFSTILGGAGSWIDKYGGGFTPAASSYGAVGDTSGFWGSGGWL